MESSKAEESSDKGEIYKDKKISQRKQRRVRMIYSKAQKNNSFRRLGTRINIDTPMYDKIYLNVSSTRIMHLTKKKICVPIQGLL